MFGLRETGLSVVGLGVYGLGVAGRCVGGLRVAYATGFQGLENTPHFTSKAWKNKRKTSNAWKTPAKCVPTLGKRPRSFPAHGHSQRFPPRVTPSAAEGSPDCTNRLRPLLIVLVAGAAMRFLHSVPIPARRVSGLRSE